jgi:hypothetical protein
VGHEREIPEPNNIVSVDVDEPTRRQRRQAGPTSGRWTRGMPRAGLTSTRPGSLLFELSIPEGYVRL